METRRPFDEITALMESYRRTLPPGIYFFAPEIVGGKQTGKILEERENYPDRSREKEFGVTFGFSPLGFVPESLKGSPPPQWLDKYPFVPMLSKLVGTHEPFLELLARHVEAKLKS